MRNPNGYGSVYKLSGKRRKPFAVAKTVSLRGGIQKRIILGYYATNKEAQIALAEYNKNPYDLKTTKVTFYEIYEKLMEQDIEKLTPKSINSKKSLIKFYEPIYKIPIKDIRLATLQNLFDSNKTYSYGTLNLKKSLCIQIFDYALKRELVEKNYGELIEINKKNEKIVIRKIFTNEEINKLWELSGIQDVDIILTMIYTGLRVNELLTLKIEDINLEDRYCKTGSKTEAGKNRLIPFNYRILPIIAKYISPEKTYLFQTVRGLDIKYANWRTMKFIPLMKKLGMEHTIHDCRHTFASLLSNVDANKVSIAKIIGHSNYGMTEKVYTHKDIEELKKAVDKITF